MVQPWTWQLFTFCSPILCLMRSKMQCIHLIFCQSICIMRNECFVVIWGIFFYIWIGVQRPCNSWLWTWLSRKGFLTGGNTSKDSCWETWLPLPVVDLSFCLGAVSGEVWSSLTSVDVSFGVCKTSGQMLHSIKTRPEKPFGSANPCIIRSLFPPMRSDLASWRQLSIVWSLVLFCWDKEEAALNLSFMIKSICGSLWNFAAVVF